jgi:hypothetical protein
MSGSSGDDGIPSAPTDPSTEPVCDEAEQKCRAIPNSQLSAASSRWTDEDASEAATLPVDENAVINLALRHPSNIQFLPRFGIHSCFSLLCCLLVTLFKR